ncbi:MAG: hypothetical protein HYS45_01785 [Parcubacteria group bacterium]|nr:hypothetical protein [Parcubacteria group bacterium]
MRVGTCPNLDEVRQKLAPHGPIPEGQWRVAFKTAYPNHDGKGPVGVADPSWVYPSGYASFPYVNSDGFSFFHCADGMLFLHWRWLAPASK